MPSSHVWNRVRRIERDNNTSDSPVLEIDSDTIMDPALMAEQMARTFADISRAKPNTHRGCTCPNMTPNFTPKPYNADYFVRERISVIKPRKPSAPDPDEISYSFLQHAHPTVLNLFNKIWSERRILTCWKNAIVIPIPKPNKIPSNYKPIALICCVWKVLKKMVADRLLHTLESNNLILPQQSSFRLFHSTQDPLLFFSKLTQKAFVSNSFVGAVFFDVQKVYDTVPRDGRS